MTHFRIVASDPSSRDRDPLEDLSDWLIAERELRGAVTYDSAAPKAGEMGAIAEALIVAVGSGGALTVLARTLGVWLSQQRSNVKLSIRRPDGASITLEATNLQDPQSVITAFVTAEPREP
jgi:hypothetical protein